MFRLLALLCAGLFLTLLIGGRDEGQARFGLQGAYDIAALKDTAARPASPVDVAGGGDPAADAPKPAAVASAPESAPEPAQAPVKDPGVTQVAFAPAEETTTVQTGLTLSLPLFEDSVPLAADAAAVGSDPAALRVGRVLGSRVNVREAPSAKAAVLDQLTKDETVTVISADGSGWTLVRIEGDGIEGYIASRYLSAPDLSAPETAGGLFPTE
jgi:hypothetical protein